MIYIYIYYIYNIIFLIYMIITLIASNADTDFSFEINDTSTS